MKAPGAAAHRSPRHWVPLHSAEAEQQWIEATIAAGISEPRLAFVRYAEPAVIYGSRGGESPARLARAEQERFAVLRRRTGGGAVLVGPWMSGFHVFLPGTHPVARSGVIAGMVWLGKAVYAALLLSRVSNRLAETPDMDAFRRRSGEAKLEWACYAGLSHGELLDAAGRKLVGLSHGRGRWGVLLSGSLLLADSPWESLEYVHLGRRPARSSLRELASAGIAGVAPSVRVPDVCARLAACVDIALDVEVSAVAMPPWPDRLDDQGARAGLRSQQQGAGRKIAAPPAAPRTTTKR